LYGKKIGMEIGLYFAGYAMGSMGCKGSKVRILSHRPLDSTEAFKERFLKAFFIGKSTSYAATAYKA
jgi:hypothetical protein